MERIAELPYEDRDPNDGSLLSIRELYLMQWPADRSAFGRNLAEVARLDKRTVFYVDLLLNGANTDFDKEIASTEQYEAWRYYEARNMTDEELRAERMRAEDHLIRTFGAYGLAMSVSSELRRRDSYYIPPTI